MSSRFSDQVISFDAMSHDQTPIFPVCRAVQIGSGTSIRRALAGALLTSVSSPSFIPSSRQTLDTFFRFARIGGLPTAPDAISSVKPISYGFPVAGACVGLPRKPAFHQWPITAVCSVTDSTRKGPKTRWDEQGRQTAVGRWRLLDVAGSSGEA